MHNPSLKFFCSLHNHINCFLCIKNLTFPSLPFSSHPSLLPPLSSSIIFLLLFLCLLPFFLTALLHHSFLSSLTSPLFPPSLQQQPKGRPLFLSFSTPLLLFYRRNNMSGLYTPHSFSPARTLSPQIRGTPEVDSQYLAELLAEHQKLGPFVQVLPICSRLLNQEILRVSGMVSNQGFGEFDRLQFRSPSPMSSANIVSNISGTGLGGWNGLAQERPSVPPGMTMDWHSAPASPSSYIVKKILRLEVPVDTYPNFNFVGRLLGPRGNSLKRVEASTGCRVYIRGKGSIKDPGKEDKLRGRPGYEHLNDPLHVLIEAELPVNVVDARLRQAQEIIEELLKPVDESQDFYKRQQLRELAMLNSSFREDSPHPSGSVSPFSNNSMKRVKTGR